MPRFSVARVVTSALHECPSVCADSRIATPKEHPPRTPRNGRARVAVPRELPLERADPYARSCHVALPRMGVDVRYRMGTRDFARPGICGLPVRAGAGSA